MNRDWQALRESMKDISYERNSMVQSRYDLHIDLIRGAEEMVWKAMGKKTESNDFPVGCSSVAARK